jgi:hypothetical protein
MGYSIASHGAADQRRAAFPGTEPGGDISATDRWEHARRRESRRMRPAHAGLTAVATRGGCMQRSFVIMIVAAGMMGSGGCASKSSADPVATPRTSTQRIESDGRNRLVTTSGDAFVSSIRLPNSPTRVFQVLPLVLAELGLPPSRIDTTALVVEAKSVAARRQLAGVSLGTYFDCGSATGIPNTTSYTLRITGWTQVEPNEIGTATLRTRVEAVARQEGVQQGAVLCSSKGKLEEKIASLAMVRATGGG